MDLEKWEDTTIPLPAKFLVLRGLDAVSHLNYLAGGPCEMKSVMMSSGAVVCY